MRLLPTSSAFGLYRPAFQRSFARRYGPPFRFHHQQEFLTSERVRDALEKPSLRRVTTTQAWTCLSPCCVSFRAALTTYFLRRQTGGNCHSVMAFLTWCS